MSAPTSRRTEALVPATLGLVGLSMMTVALVVLLLS
jgi:hypothetical protein